MISKVLFIHGRCLVSQIGPFDATQDTTDPSGHGRRQGEDGKTLNQHVSTDHNFNLLPLVSDIHPLW